jgi:hypothetical protein
MASLFEKIGSTVAGVGRAQNLPEFGISEFISGFGRGSSSSNPPSFSSTGGGIGGGARVAQKSSGFGNIISGGGTTGGGEVLGTQAPTPAPQQQQGPGLVEGEPSAPDIPSLESLIQPALDDLSRFEQETRNLLGGGEQEAEAFRSAAVSRAEQAKKEGQSEVQRRQQKEEGRAEGAIDEARRGFSELAKGLRARFGSAVSTGLGAEAIAGGQTLRAIGQIRAGIAETVNDLNIRKDQLTDIFNTAVSEANFEAENLKKESRRNLQAALGEINANRSLLQSRKADMVSRALEQYRQNVIGIRSRNAEYRQQIDLQRRATDERIRAAQASAQNTLSNLPSFELSPGQTKFVPGSQLGGEGGLSGLEGTSLPGGVEFGRAGDFGVFSAPQKEEDQIVNPFST